MRKRKQYVVVVWKRCGSCYLALLCLSWSLRSKAHQVCAGRKESIGGSFWWSAAAAAALLKLQRRTREEERKFETTHHRRRSSWSSSSSSDEASPQRRVHERQEQLVRSWVAVCGDLLAVIRRCTVIFLLYILFCCRCIHVLVLSWARPKSSVSSCSRLLWQGRAAAALLDRSGPKNWVSERDREIATEQALWRLQMVCIRQEEEEEQLQHYMQQEDHQ